MYISIPIMDFSTNNQNYANSRWPTDAILKIFFFGYISAPYWPINAKLIKTAIFANSRWRTAAILKKIALSPYISRELTDFDQIWYTDTNFHSKHGNLTKKKTKFFKFKMADGRHIVFGYISAPYWPINVKFGMGMTNHVQICHVIKMEIFPNSRWRTAAILKTVFGVYVILVMN